MFKLGKLYDVAHPFTYGNDSKVLEIYNQIMYVEDGNVPGPKGKGDQLCHIFLADGDGSEKTYINSKILTWVKIPIGKYIIREIKPERILTTKSGLATTLIISPRLEMAENLVRRLEKAYMLANLLPEGTKKDRYKKMLEHSLLLPT